MSPQDRAARARRDQNPVVLAVDIGGTKMAAAVVEGDGRLAAQSSCSTPQSTDTEVVFDALVAAVRTVLEESPAPAGRLRCGLWRSDARRRRVRVAAQHPRLARLPAP